MRRAALLTAGLAVAAGALVPAYATGGARCSSADWPMYGRDLAHTFNVPAGCSPITPTTVQRLVPAWFVHTKDSVTASPAVVGGVVYVGTWDGTFYAVDAATGAVKWTYQITAASPTAFGRIVSSAAVVDVSPGPGGPRTRVVVFGGGSTVWVLDAATGKRLTSLDLDPRTPALRAAQNASASPPVVEVESSPAIVPLGNSGAQAVYVGMDTHNDKAVGRAGLVSMVLRESPQGAWSLTPEWKYDGETGQVYTGSAGLTEGSGTGWGCGGVWSSPAVDVRRDLVYFGTASCDYPAQAAAAGFNYEENMVALDADTGALVWRYRPADDLPPSQRLADANRDTDFGASPNLFSLPGGRAVVGEGRKDARYYVRDATTGAKVTTTVAGQEGYVQQGFGVGGFLGTPGVDLAPDGTARQVIGGTAIPVPASAGDLDHTTWAVRAIDPQKGTVNWVYRLAGPTYAATSVVNGIAFVPITVGSYVVALDAATGLPLWLGPLIGPPSSAPVVVGDSLYIGTGTRETDLEYKAVSNNLQDALKGTVGESPLSPISGIQAFRLVGG
jgi:polyvinyl alcohol dehydrogenase (cytochrome)